MGLASAVPEEKLSSDTVESHRKIAEEFLRGEPFAVHWGGACLAADNNRAKGEIDLVHQALVEELEIGVPPSLEEQRADSALVQLLHESGEGDSSSPPSQNFGTSSKALAPVLRREAGRDDEPGYIGRGEEAALSRNVQARGQ